MAIVGRWEQQPAEVLDYPISFERWFENRTDSPQSVVVSSSDPALTVAGVISGQVVVVTASGGASGAKYQVTVRLTTTTGRVREADFLLSVMEV